MLVIVNTTISRQLAIIMLKKRILIKLDLNYFQRFSTNFTEKSINFNLYNRVFV